MIVLDTNVLSEAMKPSPDARVMHWLEGYQVRSLATTAISIAEVKYGLACLPEGKRRRDLEERFDLFIVKGFGSHVLSFDNSSASVYAEIVSLRKKAGRAIEAFDAMIASICRTHGTSLATRNGTHFQDCGIEILNPWENG